MLPVALLIMRNSIRGEEGGGGDRKGWQGRNYKKLRGGMKKINVGGSKKRNNGRKGEWKERRSRVRQK